MQVPFNYMLIMNHRNYSKCHLTKYDSEKFSYTIRTFNNNFIVQNFCLEVR